MHRANTGVTRRPPFRRAPAIAAVLALALAACSREEPAEPAATPPAPAPAKPAAPPPTPAQQAAQAQQQVQAAASALAAQTPEQLRENARKAQGEQRLYAPAGDNAMEYYLALREKAKDDPGVAGALIDLFPYVLIATEQSIGKGDLGEAQRLYTLMEKSDPQAPALPRIRTAIDESMAAAERRADAERLAREQAQAAERARQQAQQTATPPAATPPAAAPAQPPATEPAVPPAQTQTAPATPTPTAPAATPPAEPAPTAATPPRRPAAPRAISTPAPRYPREALRAGTTGEVTVEFVIAANGSVTDVRVLESRPSRVFDREAVSAVRRWRFEAPGEPVTLRRTIAFRP